MKQLIILLSGIIFIASCGSVRPGKLAGRSYRSECSLLGFNLLYVEFHSNGMFLYKISYRYDVTGHWRISGDTVILSSPKFYYDKGEGLDSILRAARFPWEYTNKYTDFDDNIDGYLIKGSKLYPIMKSGISEGCPLIKNSKKDVRYVLDNFPKWNKRNTF